MHLWHPLLLTEIKKQCISIIYVLRVWTKKDIEFKFVFYSHECVDAV